MSKVDEKLIFAFESMQTVGNCLVSYESLVGKMVSFNVARNQRSEFSLTVPDRYSTELQKNSQKSIIACKKQFFGHHQGRHQVAKMKEEGFKN